MTVSVQQIAEELGVDRGTIYGWMQRYQDFPAPVEDTHRGRRWDPDQVRAWHQAADLSPGRPRRG